MRELLAVLLLPFALTSADASVELTFQDPEIVESSGLAVVGDWLVTTNDSGDTGRIFTVDHDGATVGVTDWSAKPRDVEAVAPAGADEVWVADIGDNLATRDSISVSRVPVGARDQDADVPSYELVYPDGARDAESLLVDPTDGRLYVATKEIFGGVLMAAPEELDPDRPNQLTEVGEVLPIATDGTFFPDGRHLVVRNYDEAVVYSFPTLEEVGRVDLPEQDQGEGLAVDGDDLLISTEGQFTDVLRVPLPAGVVSAVAEPSASPSPSASPTVPEPPKTESREGKDLPETTESTRKPWPWFLSGFIGLGIIVVLMWSLRRR